MLTSGSNYTEEERSLTCPAGMVVMKVDWASVGVPYGYNGKCPANFIPDDWGKRPWPVDICKDYVHPKYVSLRLEDVAQPCASPTSKVRIEEVCVGRNKCSPPGNETHYNLVCPRHNLLQKSLATTMSVSSHIPRALSLVTSLPSTSSHADAMAL